MTNNMLKLGRFVSVSKPNVPAIYSNLFSSWTEHNVQKQDINKNVVIGRAGREHIDYVISFLKTHYFEDEPVCASLNLRPSNNAVLEDYCMKAMSAGTTIIAEEDGNLVGVTINSTSCPWDSAKLEQYAEHRQCPGTVALLRFLAMIQRVPKVYDTFKEKQIWEMCMLTVAREHRGRGIGSMLVRESLQFGRDMGYRIARMDCSNSYSSRIADELGMECIYRYPFGCFRDSFGQPVFTCAPLANTHMKVYVDCLRKTSKLDDRWLKESHLNLNDSRKTTAREEVVAHKTGGAAVI